MAPRGLAVRTVRTITVYRGYMEIAVSISHLTGPAVVTHISIRLVDTVVALAFR